MYLIDVTADNIKLFWPDINKLIVDSIGRGHYMAVGAMEEGKALGIVVYTVRGAGEGNEGNTGVLIYLSGDDEAIRALLDEYRMRSYKFSIISTIVETPDQKLSELLADYGFDMEEGESIDIYLKVQDIENITAFKDIKTPDLIRPLGYASPIEFRYFLQEYAGRVDEGPLFDIESIPMDWYDTDVSCICIDEEGIDAAFLVRFDGNDTVIAEVLAGLGPESFKKLPYLLAYAASNALYTYTPDTKIIIRRRNKSVIKLVDKILNGKKGAKIYRGILM